MARPNKQGVDYFPLDVHLDDKFKFIEIKYKLEGFATIIKLMQKIYSYGYWYKWTEDEALLFADEIKSDFSLVNGVVDEALERGVFDKGLFESYGILTSKGIQKRYKEIVRRRKDVEVTTEYLLIDDNFGVNDDINQSEGKRNDGKSTQSKVKESKVNETKGNETKLNSYSEEPPKMNPFIFFESSGFGTLSPTITDDINYWIDGKFFEEPNEIILKAMGEAVKSNARTWRYVEKVLINWSNKGLKTIQMVEADIKAYEESKKPKLNLKTRDEPLPDWIQKQPKKQSPQPSEVVDEEKLREVNELLRALGEIP
jgi:DnaD/phage-associated family protein